MIVQSVNQSDANTCGLEPLHRRQQRAIQLVMHGALYAYPALSRQMAVKQDLHIDPPIIGVDQAIYYAVVMIPHQISHQEQ